VLGRLFRAMRVGGVLTTYCAKGEVRRTLQSLGFEVERLPGPPRKREMLRATKPGPPLAQLLPQSGEDGADANA
jgi:tRNA U34 5-methylaminomethyl-2-thiouridine-forming methyltransferase MnmC